MKKKIVVSGVMLVVLGGLPGTRARCATVEEGRKVFVQKKCINCHSLGAERGAVAKLGGPLDGIGSKRGVAWLRGYFADPKAELPNAKMPKQNLTPKQIDDLVDYMLTIK